MLAILLKTIGFFLLFNLKKNELLQESNTNLDELEKKIFFDITKFLHWNANHKQISPVYLLVELILGDTLI